MEAPTGSLGGPMVRRNRLAKELEAAVRRDRAEAVNGSDSGVRQGRRTSHTVVALLGQSAGDLATARQLGRECRLVRLEPGHDLTVVPYAEQPALFLLSADLLGLDLVGACRSLRNGVAGQRVPILVISSAAEPGEALRAFAAGADDFLVVEPFRPVQLRTRVRMWLMRAAYA
jgi:PleD family two-component response regulator